MNLLKYARVVILLAVVNAIGGVSASRADGVLTPNDLMQITNLVEVQISPDGRQVVYGIADADLEKNMFRFSLQRSGTTESAPAQLTNGPTDFCPRWAPDSRRLAFLSDRGGADQICVISA